MELRVLKYFTATVRCRSISAASRELYVTQPTLTRQLHDLEEELGQTLLIRSAHGITLTPAGLTFYQRATELLELSEKIKNEIKSEGQLRGKISIGAAECPAMLILSRAMSKLNLEHPFVTFEVTTMTRDMAANYLGNGLIDFAVLIPKPGSDFDYLQFNDPHEWGLILRADHPLSNNDFIRPQDLRGLPVIMSKGELRTNLLDAWLGYPLEKLRIVAIYSLITNALMMARAGLGAIVGFNDTVELPPDLKFVPFTPKITADAYLAWSKGRAMSACARELLEIFKGELSLIKPPSEEALC